MGTSVIRRLRRAPVQIGGVIKMIEDGRAARHVVDAARGAAVPGARPGRFKIIADGPRQCLADTNGRGQTPAARS